MRIDDQIDQIRGKYSFRSPKVLMDMVGSTNNIFDPYSVLIGSSVKVGEGNVFYPNVIIECVDGGKVDIGNNNVFYPGTYILGSAGNLTIGNGNEFGTGGCTIRANMPDANIQIGDNGRYCSGADIMGKTMLGDGSQVLGNITVQDCSLSGGGTFKESDPDKRAAVLKGYGLARGVTLTAGQVVNGAGNFTVAKVEQQSAYHPKKS